MLFRVSPKTKPADLWVSGTMTRTATNTSTPTMCHHAEIEFSIAVIGTLSMLINPAANRIMP